MSNSNNISNNPNELEARLTVRGTSWNPPQFVPAHVSDDGMRSRSNNYVLRSIRRTTPRGRNDVINRRYTIRLRFCRRVLALNNESRKSVMTAITEALQIDLDTPNGPEDDRMSYHIELNEPYVDRFHERVRNMARTNTFSRSDEVTDNNDDNNDDYDNNENNDDDIDSIGFNPSLYESDNNTQELNNENETPQSDSYIFNILNRTASSGRYILNNLFTRNRRSDDHRGRDL